MSEALARQVAALGVRDPRVLDAVRRVPRERFVPPAVEHLSDADRPLPIGFGQTISQPFIVAFMSEWLRLEGHERVLEIGTGSGYQAAILALLAREVFSVEILPELSARAAAALESLGVANVRLRVGDGRQGWPDAAPFDRVVVTAAAESIPEPLVRQLAPGGRLVAPVGEGDEQRLTLVVKGADGKLDATELLPVRFVPLTGDRSPPAAPSA